MSNDFTIWITVACAPELVDAANQLALALGYSAADAETYDERNMVGGYVVADFPSSQSFMAVAQGDLTSLAAAKGASPDLVQQAQQAMVVWSVGDAIAPPAAAPGAMTVIIQPIQQRDSRAALALMGL